MQTVPMRNAFSMVTAIFVIVIMSTVAMLVMSVSGKIVKTTTTQYQHEQAVLYAKSYTEYAVMAVTAHDRGINCIQTITGSIGTPANGNGYSIRAEIAYIGPPAEIGNCPATRQLNVANVINVNTPLTIIIDVYVDYKDPDNTSGPSLTVHRRTVQKI